MEIHAPEGHVNSLRDVVIHLAIVTVGILIALGLEQTVEWYHHREVAREARENILSETRDNSKELKGFLDTLQDMHKNQGIVINAVDDIRAHGKTTKKDLNLGLRLAQISQTSWTTAQTIGALSWMPYAEVKKYAAIYDLQDQFVRLQARSLDAVVSATSAFAQGQDPATFSHAQLDAERVKVLDLGSAVTAEGQLATQLQKAYEELLTGDKAK